MSILDKIHLNDFGDLIIEITNEGIFSTKNNSSVNYEFYIVIKSLDSNLTSHLMYHHCPIGYDLWTYNNNIFYINEDNHPGICIEIYDKTNKELIFSKNYHNSKKYRCLELESKRFDVTYPSYHTFFNDTYFLQNFKIKDDDVVYDLGANIGAFSIACSNYNVKKIYAFEPHPEIYGCLNYNLNRYGKNCTTFNNAISDDFKTVKFGTSESTVASSIKDDGAFEVESINLEKFSITPEMIHQDTIDFFPEKKNAPGYKERVNHQKERVMKNGEYSLTENEPFVVEFVDGKYKWSEGWHRLLALVELYEEGKIDSIKGYGYIIKRKTQ